jgi:hypothetical protein
LDKLKNKPPRDKHSSLFLPIVSYGEKKFYMIICLQLVLNEMDIKPKAESQKPKAKSQKPKAKSQKPKAKSKKPKAKSQKPKAKSQKPKAKSQKP